MTNTANLARNKRIRSAILALGISALFASYFQPLQHIDALGIGVALRFLEPRHSEHRVTVVDFTDPSNADLAPALSGILRNVRNAGALAVGITVPLDRNSTPVGAERESLQKLARKKGVAIPANVLLDQIDPDGMLVKQIKSTSNVVLAEPVYAPKDSDTLNTLKIWFAKINRQSDGHLVSTFLNLFGAPPTMTVGQVHEVSSRLREVATKVGAIYAETGPMNSISNSLFVDDEGYRAPGFAAAMAWAVGQAADTEISNLGDGVKIGEAKFNTLADYRWFPRQDIDPKNGPIRIIRADQIQEEENVPLLKDKVVLIGKVLPRDNMIAARNDVLSQANLVSNLLSKDGIETPSWYYHVQRLLIIGAFVFCMSIPGRLADRRSNWKVAGGLLIGLNAALLGVVVFNFRLPFVLPILVIAAAWLLAKGLIELHDFIMRGFQDANIARTQFARNLRHVGNLDESFAQLEACGRTGIVCDPLYELGLAYERKRNYERAAEVYEHLVFIDPNFKDARSRQGNLEDLASRFSGELPSSQNRNGVLVGGEGLELPTIGHYRLQRKLGRGAMGIVYLATDTKLGREVALKTLSIDDGFSEEAAEEARLRFSQEAELAAKLQHANIITVYEVGKEDDLSYIAMDYFECTTLEPFTDPDFSLSLHDVIRLGAEVAEALAYAHDTGIIHRDIKPGNILYQEKTKQVRITDFGIARLIDEKRTATGTILGTPSYLSPEQATGDTVDGRADIYSLAVVLYQLLCGRLPFMGDSTANLIFKIATEPAPDPRQFNAELPEKTAQAILQALEKEPNKRFDDGREMARALIDSVVEPSALEQRLAS